LARGSAPRVSAIIPTHNRAGMVSGAVESVLNQRSAPGEVIVVDDFSTDETAEALQTFGSAIRVIRTDRNVERGAARNLGAAAAEGELVAFLDADDEWDAAKLEVQLADAQDDLPSVTGVWLIDGSGRTIGGPYSPPSTAYQDIGLENRYLASPSSILLPRTVHESVGGFPEDRRIQGSEDWVFLVKLVAAGFPIVTIEQPLVRYRVHPANSTADPENLARSMWSSCEWMERAAAGPDRLSRRRRARAATAIGCAFAGQGRWGEAVSWSATAISGRMPAESLRATWRIARSGAAGLVRGWRQR
jgi:glycosyltransferase involved in cell wall biosynthesis